MASQQKQRVEVPDELKDVLVRFAIAYLLEQPDDLIDYGLTFFAKERDGRQGASVGSVESGSGTATACPPLVPCPGGPAKERCGTCAPETEGDGGPATCPKTDRQRALLRGALSEVSLFRTLDEQQTNDLLDAMHEKPVRAQDVLGARAADGANFYVVESGVYECYLGDDRQHSHTVHRGGSFGERGFFGDCLHDHPAATAIRAVQDGTLWAIDRPTYERTVRRAVDGKRQAHEALLGTVPMLRSLPSHERAELADGLVTRTYARGEQLLLQNDTADGLYFVEQGTVAVRIVDDEDEVELARVEPGGYFGELALAMHWPPDVSAWAVDDVRVAFLDAEALLRLREPCTERWQGNTSRQQQDVLIYGSQNNLVVVW